MGNPVVCGVEDRQAKSRMRELWGEMPFYSATEKTPTMARYFWWPSGPSKNITC